MTDLINKTPATPEATPPQDTQPVITESPVTDAVAAGSAAAKREMPVNNGHASRAR